MAYFQQNPLENSISKIQEPWSIRITKLQQFKYNAQLLILLCFVLFKVQNQTTIYWDSLLRLRLNVTLQLRWRTALWRQQPLVPCVRVTWALVQHLPHHIDLSCSFLHVGNDNGQKHGGRQHQWNPCIAKVRPTKPCVKGAGTDSHFGGKRDRKT